MYLHNTLCIYIIHYVQFIILEKNPGLCTLWTDYEHYELPKPVTNRPRLWCTRTTTRAKNNGNTVISGRERAKHIDIWTHFAHEVIQNCHMKLILVTTFQQLADILTNPLHSPQLQACVAGILGKKKVTTSKRPIKSGGPLGAVGGLSLRLSSLGTTARVS